MRKNCSFIGTRPSNMMETLERRTLLAAGGLDTSFGMNGVAEITAASGARLAATEVMADGRLVLAETMPGGSISVLRMHTDGTPDGSFGSAGRQVSVLGGEMQVFGVAIQEDNKIVVGGSHNDEAFLLRYLTNGRHDRSFGNGGVVRIAFPPAATSVVRDVAIQSDGRILLAGESTNSRGITAVALARVNPDGNIDGSFGEATGFTVTRFGFPGASADTFGVNRLAIAPNGALLTAGDWFNGAEARTDADDGLAIGRFTSNGIPDDRFGRRGVALRDFAATNETASGITVDAENRPIVAVTGADVFGVFRLDTRGRGDSGFGLNGLARAADSGDAADVILQNDGKIVLGGALDQIPVVARLNADGALDAGFGRDGISDIPFPASEEAAGESFGIIQRLTLAPDTTILASGTVGSTAAPRLATARLFPEAGPLGTPITRPLTELTFNSYDFRVEWRASEGIDTTTISNSNIVVTGPNDYLRNARLVSIDTSLGENRVVARYKVAPPVGIGIWNPIANGEYDINVQPNQVADLEGNFAPPGSIGTFLVNIQV